MVLHRSRIRYHINYAKLKKKKKHLIIIYYVKYKLRFYLVEYTKTEKIKRTYPYKLNRIKY